MCIKGHISGISFYPFAHKHLYSHYRINVHNFLENHIMLVANNKKKICIEINKNKINTQLIDRKKGKFADNENPQCITT